MILYYLSSSCANHIFKIDWFRCLKLKDAHKLNVNRMITNAVNPMLPYYSVDFDTVIINSAIFRYDVHSFHWLCCVFVFV